MAIEGVEGPTKFVGKDNFEVRQDGFGRMTDKQVAEYKRYRPRRYAPDLIADLEQRVAKLEAT